MDPRWHQFYQPPRSPLARLGLALAGIGILALSFLLGLFVLAVAMGLAVVGVIALTVRRWLGLGQRRRRDRDGGPIEVEYRVVHRERDKRDDQ